LDVNDLGSLRHNTTQCTPVTFATYNLFP
jgi:hypothetical protein